MSMIKKYCFQNEIDNDWHTCLQNILCVSKSLLYIMLWLIVITYSDVHILTVIKYSITYWFY